MTSGDCHRGTDADRSRLTSGHRDTFTVTTVHRISIVINEPSMDYANRANVMNRRHGVGQYSYLGSFPLYDGQDEG